MLLLADERLMLMQLGGQRLNVENYIHTKIPFTIMKIYDNFLPDFKCISEIVHEIFPLILVFIHRVFTVIVVRNGYNQ